MYGITKPLGSVLTSWPALFGIGLCALAIGCGGQSVAESEKEQLSAVKEMGGTAEVNEEGHIVKIDLHGQSVTDADVEKLVGLPQLKELDVRDTQVTDATLETAKKFPSLEYLDVSVTEVTQAGVDKFKEENPDIGVSGPGV